MGKDLTGGIEQGTTYDFSNIQIEESTSSGKDIFFIAGEKGAGKTTLALLNEGEILAFTYDSKTQRIKQQDFDNSKRIHVFDIKTIYSKSLEQKLESGALAFDTVMKLLYESPDGSYDWVLHDFYDLLPSLAEMKARKVDGKTAMQPISQFDPAWKKRKAFLEDCHIQSCRVARKGVIYTGYTFTADIVVDGTIISTGPRKPKWTGIIEQETDVTIMVDCEEERKKDGRTMHRFAFIYDSKYNKKWKKHCWYSIDTMEQAKEFMEGNGTIINREPPTPMLIESITKIATEPTQTEPPKPAKSLV